MSNIAELHEKVYAHLTENHPKLRFTLRKINRGGRLDSGYWFHGNDQYLLFTFWDYWDANTKTPLIYFSTWIGNTTDLSLAVEHCADSEINDFFVNELRPVLDIKEIYKTIKHTDGLLAAIDLAINHDKKIIDTLINGNKYISTIIKPVEEELFNRTKDNIERYRNAKLITTEQDDEIFEYKDTKFQELNIKNIRHISPTRLDFHQNLTCFIGMNGTGKTTLLQAIALAAVRNEKNYFLQNTLQEDKITWLLRMEMDKKSRLPLFSKNGHGNQKS